MNTYSDLKEKLWGKSLVETLHYIYGVVSDWIQQNTYPLLIAISAALGIVLQMHLRKLDPLSAMVDSSIWVVVCYTICAFLLFHVISLHLIKLLLRIAETYYKSIKISKTWHLYFISGYFLVLYGFLYCLSLWM